VSSAQLRDHLRRDRPGNTGCGCLSVILTVLAIWALIFGVTVGGKHHELGCSCSKGVVIE
jgi:hypothetical protein